MACCKGRQLAQLLVESCRSTKQGLRRLVSMHLPVSVGADQVEAVARLVVGAHGEGHERRRVAGEVVPAAGLQAPCSAL
jgi:hypothetical protein